MTDDHPTPEMLDRLLAGTAADPESRWAVAHLVGHCEVCTRYLRAALDEMDAADGSARYDALFTGVLDRSASGLATIRAELLEATTLWGKIEHTPPARRRDLIVGDARYHTWAVAERFLDAAAEFHWQDTPSGLEACRLALVIAERLPPAAYPEGLNHDLRARALAGLADALRLDRQMDDARATLRQAWEALDDGTGDPLERAALMRVEAGLELAAGDHDRAAALLRPAAGIYRLYGDRHQEGRTLQRLARVIGHEDPAQGVALAERALALIEPGRDPLLDLAALHVLIWSLNDCGMPAQAFDLLERWRPLYLQCRETEPQLMLSWLEARICRRLGLLEVAERRLVAVWHDFHQAAFPQELTLVSLDLAETYIARGKTRHAIRLLKTFHGILGTWRMHPEGMAAWLLLVDAVAGEASQAQTLTRETALYFRQAWPGVPPSPKRRDRRRRAPSRSASSPAPGSPTPPQTQS
jgi:tetratricopeptide (TPR) repeat protein